MQTVFLRSVSAFPVTKQVGNGGLVSPNYSISCSSVSTLPLFSGKQRNTRSLVVSATSGETLPLTGVIFHPFEEVKREEFIVPISPQVSLARQYYVDECEAAINEQIKSVTFIAPLFRKNNVYIDMNMQSFLFFFLSKVIYIFFI